LRFLRSGAIIDFRQSRKTMNELFAILLQETRDVISLKSLAEKKKACERANITMELLIAEHGMSEEELSDLLQELV
jgi:AraC-like DNA-binding protein